ncbi:MAG: hypothetical protein RJA75_842 [Actinomycetota bacterium]|jgi:hypothetical protein
MARRRIKHDEGISAINAVIQADKVSPISDKDPVFVMAVRYLLEELAEVAPGNSVEVRVPPLGATQCIEGPRHTRGTPPNVVEMSPRVWFDLALGNVSWEGASAEHMVSSSGVRASLDEVLPLTLKHVQR